LPLEAIPTLPKFFDKSRLETSEFAKYIYDIKFKQSNKTVHGLSLDGYVYAAHPYLKSIKSEILHYGHTTDKRPLSCVVKATVTLSYRPSEDADPIDITVEAMGDGDVQDVPNSGSLVRTVETRALNRAFARLLDTSKADLNNEFIGEDELGSLANTEANDNRSGRTSPQDIKARKEQKYMNDGDELDNDADQAPERLEYTNSEGDKITKEPGLDW